MKTVLFLTLVGLFLQDSTAGVHVYQYMYGCEWDDETDEISGHRQIGYDGEGFLVFDMKTFTWVAAQQQAVSTKKQLNNDKDGLANNKNYLTQICPEWLKKFSEYGKSSMMRKDLPTVSLLQKTPSSQITCHATGFYPNQAAMFWRKDGEELFDNVERDDLELPSDDWGKYECVFQLSGVRTDLVTKLDKKDIKTNYMNSMNMIIGIVAAVLLLVVIVCVAGFFIWKNRNTVYGPAVEEVEQQPLHEKA